ncbi:MAG: hypothetical protein HQK52_03075 [Oligoflexia bacterium]|nr:hypothetical protein [Oligoflexia bacterium]
MKKIILLIGILMTTNLSELFALERYSINKGPKIIADQLEREVNFINDTLMSVPAVEDAAATIVAGQMYFNHFEIRVEPYVEFGVSGFASLKVFPILEIQVDRDPPSGYQEL